LVTDLLTEVRQRVYPVGRLDFDTEGLLILTNDGDFAHRVIHPRYQLARRYELKVQGPVSLETLQVLAAGLWLEDGFTGPAQVVLQSVQQNTTHLSLEIYSGKKRIIRRMMAAIGHPVIQLKRVALSFLTLGETKPGAYRHLKQEEVEKLLARAETGA
jgi:23S rRNA pseudouridine2605 synthase